jgi:hypothetical protein
MERKREEETVEVIACFTDTQISPVRFRWNGSVYHIKEVTAHWTRTEGYYTIHHFTVDTREAGIMEITLDSRTLTWKTPLPE